MKLKTLLMLVAVAILWNMDPAYADDVLNVNVGNGITIGIPGAFDSVDSFWNVIPGRQDTGMSTKIAAWKALTLGFGAVVSDPGTGAPYGKLGLNLANINIPVIPELGSINVAGIGGYDFKASQWVIGVCLSKDFTIKLP